VRSGEGPEIDPARSPKALRPPQIGHRRSATADRPPQIGHRSYTASVAASDGMVDRLDTPLFVVTAVDGPDRSGCLVGFATQCSIDPFRFLVCISVENHTYELAARAPVLAVHLLGAGQHAVAALFGGHTGDAEDKFGRCAWHPGIEGVPVLDQCAAWLEGRVVQRIPLGDHVGMVLEPEAGGTGGAHGCLTLADVTDLEPAHPA